MAVAGVLLAGAGFFVVTEIQAHWFYPGLAGVWVGTYFNQRVALKITRDNGTYAARFNYIDVGIDAPATHLRLGPKSIRFGIPGAADAFSGTLDPARTWMAGQWRQGTNVNPLTLTHTDKPAVGPPLADADCAQRPGSDLQGCWKGSLRSGTRQRNATLRIAEESNGKLRAEMDWADWGGHQIPAVSASRDGGLVKIRFQVLGNFEGTLDAASGQLIGPWRGFGETNSASFSRADLQAEQSAKNFVSASPDELQGHWRGMIRSPNGGLHFVFHIAKMPDGSFSAALDDPDEGESNVGCTSAQFTPPHVSIMWGGIRGIFNGSLKDGKLTGTWRQYGRVQPLTLRRDS
jgi:hypothetical protein